MQCPDCGSTNTGDAAAATYADSVCKDCGRLFMHEEAPTYRQPGLTGMPDEANDGPAN